MILSPVCKDISNGRIYSWPHKSTARSEMCKRNMMKIFIIMHALLFRRRFNAWSFVLLQRNTWAHKSYNRYEHQQLLKFRLSASQSATPVSNRV